MSTIEGVYGFQIIVPPPPPALYSFSNMTFTPAGATDSSGPTLSQCKAAYSSQSWTSNSSYFNMTTQGYQLWTVPLTGNYTITCQGAEGASPQQVYSGNDSQYITQGGYGANITGTFTLTQGDIYKIVVGQKSSNGYYGGGGGGGSFFASSTNTPLVCAGGGGGGSYYGNYSSCNTNYGNYPLCNSVDGVTGTSGSRGGYSPYGGGIFLTNGGTGGNGGGYGGNGGGEEGGGGGGFTGNGQDDIRTANTGGKSFINGAVGGVSGGNGSSGGFGGGGTGYYPYWYSGGGGGGYSGGGAGGVFGNGGGGGSYNAGSNQINIPGASSGTGYVYIEKEVLGPPPTPSSGTFTIAAATLIGTATWPRTLRTVSYSVSLYKNSIASTSGATLVSTVTGITASSVKFSSLLTSTYYYFTVTSVNTYGSSLGPISSFAIPTVATAPTITGFSVDSATMVATITWNATADTNSYTIQLYKNSTQSTSGATLVTTSTGITGLTAGYTITPFYYHYILLTSVNLAGSSTASQSSYIISVIPSTPSTPTIVMNSATMVITVNWTTTQWAVTYNVALYSNTIQSTPGATLVSTTTNISGLTTTFSGLSPFTYYYVILTATNQTGTSSAQSTYLISAAPPTPSPPILYISSSLVGNAFWDAQPNAATYTVYLYSNASSNYSGTFLASNTSISGLSTTFSSLVQGTYYYATMTGTNSTGTSSASSNSSIAVYDPAGLYSFTSFTFTNAGATLQYGPTLAQCRTAYSSASWIAASNSYYFSVSPQGIQNWAVPKTGDYTITCVGARGGAGNYTNYPGGLGTTMIGTFTLTRDTILHILVGQIGEQNTSYIAGGGGGGGSFVVTGTNTPLICAGGGAGGNNSIPQTNLAYLLQSVTTTTANPEASYSGIEPTTAGSNGSGGKPSQYYPNGGAPGGGLLTDGVNPTKVSTYPTATAGKSFVNGGVGGLPSAANGGIGGFGGGGGADWYYYTGSGGGGGYSGGGGTSGSGSSSVSGGGGSYNGGSNQSNTAANNSGMGYVTIVAL